jgi:hypothetical protein
VAGIIRGREEKEKRGEKRGGVFGKAGAKRRKKQSRRSSRARQKTKSSERLKTVVLPFQSGSVSTTSTE